jgi:hypothetical protein
MSCKTRILLAAALAMVAACTHIRIHDLDSSAPNETVTLKNEDVTKWLEHYAGAEVPAIRFCKVGNASGPICDQPTPASDGRIVFSFIHLSDTQLYDERVVIVSTAVANLFDRFVDSARLDPGQAKHDTAVYLALVSAINRWNASVCETNGGASPQNPMFVVHTGDEIHADVYQELWEFLQVSSQLQLPWFPLIGNHDVMTFGTRPAMKETVTTIETDRPSLAMNLIREPDEFMRFHGAGERIKLPPGIEITLPAYAPGTPACDAGVRGGDDAPIVGNPFDAFEIPAARGATGACSAWSAFEETLRSSGTQPGYYSWTSGAGQSRIPESWRDRTLGKNIRLRFLFLDTAQDITFSAGGIMDDQLAWVLCQLEQAEQNRDYVIAFGHHPLSSLLSTRESVGQRDSRYSEIARELIDAFAANDRFLGYFTGHTHRYDNGKVCAESGRCFHEIQAPSAVQQVPQSGLLVRIVEPRLSEGGHATLEVHPFTGPWVEAGYESLDCDAGDPDLGPELPDLATAARLGSEGALRHLGCRDPEATYREELGKLESLFLETEVAVPLTP